MDRDRQPDVLARFELGDLHPVGVGWRRPRSRAQLAQLLPDDRVRRPDQLGLRDVAVEHQPLEDAAELRVAFFVAAQVGAEIVERAHRPRMSGSGRPDSSSPFGTSSGGKVTGTVSMLERTPALPAVTQNDVPPRIDFTTGFETGM